MQYAEWTVPFNTTNSVQSMKAKKTIDYKSMTLAQLKELAKERELIGYSSLNKADLIELLKDNE